MRSLVAILCCVVLVISLLGLAEPVHRSADVAAESRTVGHVLPDTRCLAGSGHGACQFAATNEAPCPSGFQRLGKRVSDIRR